VARVTVRVPPEALQPALRPVGQQTPAASPPPPSRQSSSGAKYLLYGGGMLLVLVLVILLVNDRRHLKQEVNKLSSTTQADNKTQNDGQKYQEEVSKLIEVPAGVTPLANIPSQDDLAKLQSDNPIYKNVQAGDVFLIYTLEDKSLFLVVFRPTTHKIVLATAGSQQSTPAPAATQPVTPKTVTPTKTR
jgi:hypothetical protein